MTGADGRLITPAERYLADLRDRGRSPHTIRGHAYGLAAWWTVLEATGTAWDHLPDGVVDHFIIYLRTGDLPGVARIGPPPTRLAPSSVAVRAAAVAAFYSWSAVTLDLRQPAVVLELHHGSGAIRRRHALSRPTGRAAAPARRTPLLSPVHVHIIMDGCARRDDAGAWRPNLAGLRDRLLFAMLAETGMRLGEALALRHCDIHPGADEPWLQVTAAPDPEPGRRGSATRNRRIRIGAALIDLYAAYVLGLVDAGIDLTVAEAEDHVVFVNVAGRPRFAPMRPESVYGRVAALNRRHRDLPAGWSPHSLRHTCAAALLLTGRSLAEVARQLGHRDLHTTETAYGWVLNDRELLTQADWAGYTTDWAPPDALRT